MLHNGLPFVGRQREVYDQQRMLRTDPVKEAHLGTRPETQLDLQPETGPGL
jgi:hypothetical protein